MARKFLIKLKDVHEASGKSIYRVAKDAGVQFITAKKYVTQNFETDKLSPEVVAICGALGVDWRDPTIIQVFDEGESDTKPIKPIADDDTDDEEIKPHLLTA